MRQAQPVADHQAGKLFRRQSGQGCVERKFIQLLNTQFFQPVCPGIATHQTKGRRVGRKILARVGFKSQDAQRSIRSGAAGQVNDRLMADVNTIEIADGGTCAPVLGLDKLEIPNDLHCGCLAGLPGRFKTQIEHGAAQRTAPNHRVGARQSNLRLGANTMASPTRTFLPSTEQ